MKQGMTIDLQFLAKKYHVETLNMIVYQTAPLVKLPPGGFIFTPHKIHKASYGGKCKGEMKIDSYIYFLQIETCYFA